MKFLIATSLTFLAALAAPSAFAGPQGSGGGKGVVCRNSRGQVQSAELLDLWEAREVFHMNPKLSSAPVKTQVAKAIEAMRFVTQTSPDSGLSLGGADETDEPTYLVKFLTRVTNLMLEGKEPVFGSHGISLTPTDDSLELAQPTGNCHIEQLVDYVDAPALPKILVNLDLVNRLDKTNQAALYLHEALYVFLRGYSDFGNFDAYREPNSIRVRRAIGYVFAGHSFPSLVAQLPKTYVECSGTGNDDPDATVGLSTFFIYSDANGDTHSITTRLFGQRMLGLFPASGGIGPEGFLQKDQCDNTGPVKNNYQKGPGFVSNVIGVGPVDFQTEVWLNQDCAYQRRVWVLAPDANLSFADQRSQVLTCKQVTAP